MNMNTIFISHIQEDAELALKIAGYLETKGIKCSYSASLARGSKKIENTKKAIAETDGFVLLITSKSVESQELNSQFTEAVTNSKPVIVILIDISPKDFGSGHGIGPAILDKTNLVPTNPEDLKPMIDKISDGIQKLGIRKEGSTIEVFDPFESRIQGLIIDGPMIDRLGEKRKLHFSIILAVGFLAVISFLLFNRFWDSDILELDSKPVLDSIGGDLRMDTISGTVRSKYIRDNNIVIYAYTNMWYVQPVDTIPLTEINENGSWLTTTHLGSKYLIMLVGPDYVPAKTKMSDPKKDDKVISYLAYPND